MGVGRPLTRDEILAAKTVPSELLEVPELGGTVRVQGFSLATRIAFYAITAGLEGDARAKAVLELDSARLAAYGLVDEAGDALFSEADIPVLRRHRPAVLDRIAAVVLRLSGVGELAAEEAQKN